MKDTLYIIGNGFDIHHKIKSKYKHFKKYVKKKDITLFNLINEYLSIEYDWADFEKSLSTIDTDSLIDNASNVLVSYTDDDWSDASHHDYQYEIEQVVQQLSNILEKHFIDWLLNISIPNRKKANQQLLKLDTNATYLNFNYTNTLQKIYKIKKSKILHIHGSLKNQNDIVLGHNWKPTNNKYLDTPYDQGDIDVRIMEGNEIIEQYFNSTFKPTKQIIKQNKKFFSKLKKIDRIYILGHSVSEVDFKYFQAIMKKIDRKNVCWIISYFTQEDKTRYKQQFENLEIDNRNIKYIKLTKLMKKSTVKKSLTVQKEGK